VIIAAADPSLSFGGIDSASGILTDILMTFMRLLNNGGQKIVDAEMEMAGALLAFQFLKFVLQVGFGSSAIKHGILQFLCASAWYTVARNAVPVTIAFSSWMGSLGSFLSEGAYQGDVMHNPSQIVTYGFEAFSMLMEQADSFDMLTGLVYIGVYTIEGLLIIFGFVTIGVVAIYTVLRATLDLLIGIALLPFIIEDQLKPLASQGISMIVRAGVGLGATSLVVGTGHGFLQKIRLQPTPTMRDGMNLMIATLVIAILCGGVSTMLKGIGLSAAVKRL
jgi:hypothetical protein